MLSIFFTIIFKGFYFLNDNVFNFKFRSRMLFEVFRSIKINFVQVVY